MISLRVSVSIFYVQRHRWHRETWWVWFGDGECMGGGGLSRSNWLIRLAVGRSATIDWFCPFPHYVERETWLKQWFVYTYKTELEHFPYYAPLVLTFLRNRPVACWASGSGLGPFFKWPTIWFSSNKNVVTASEQGPLFLWKWFENFNGNNCIILFTILVVSHIFIVIYFIVLCSEQFFVLFNWSLLFFTWSNFFAILMYRRLCMILLQILVIVSHISVLILLFSFRLGSVNGPMIEITYGIMVLIYIIFKYNRFICKPT